MLIKRFMANRQLCSNLLGAKLLRDALNGGFKHIRLNATDITTTYGPLLGKSIGLLWSVPAAPFVPSNFYRNDGLNPAKVIGN